jgi:hypothetical protein
VSTGLRFGLFPLGLAGGPGGVASGPADAFERIAQAVQRLQGAGPPLLIRMCVVGSGAGSTEAALAQVSQLADSPQLRWDLVLAYRDPAGEVDAWARFVATVVERYGERFDAIQVTGEANLTSVPAAADGAFPGATDAFVDGVISAGEAKRRRGATAAIGFAVSPEIEPHASPFWPAVAATGGDRLPAAVDYAGLDTPSSPART